MQPAPSWTPQNCSPVLVLLRIMARRPLRTRCSYTSPSSHRCTTMVPLADAIRFTRASRFPFYCPRHQKTLLSPTDLVIRKPPATRTVKFGCQNTVDGVVYVLTRSLAFVPPSLEDRTRLVLRCTMSSALLDSDKSGFIYALELYGEFRVYRVRQSRDFTFQTQRVRTSSASKSVGLRTSRLV